MNFQINFCSGCYKKKERDFQKLAKKNFYQNCQRNFHRSCRKSFQRNRRRNSQENWQNNLWYKFQQSRQRNSLKCAEKYSEIQKKFLKIYSKNNQTPPSLLNKTTKGIAEGIFEEIAKTITEGILECIFNEFP